jgi:hypothetical protein
MATSTKSAHYSAWTKAIRDCDGPPQYSASWVNARRGWFEVFDDRVQCGDWVIQAESVLDAVLFEARQWFIPVYILSISTAEGTWQFGFNPWAKFDAHLPFSFRRERVRLRYSAFSIAVRLLLIVCVTYWIWRRFG